MTSVMIILLLCLYQFLYFVPLYPYLNLSLSVSNVRVRFLSARLRQLVLDPACARSEDVLRVPVRICLCVAVCACVYARNCPLHAPV